MKRTTQEIKQMFLNFFKEKKHIVLPGSSLVTSQNSSLLFTNAGMNQFKDIFLEKNCNFKHTRVVTIQNCLRTGGKHNDFENVGYTSKHHTFFEMLGNFSFGDYFKTEAIAYAWEFLTSKKWLHLSKEKLWITVYEYDLESYNIWKNITNIPETRIIKIGNKQNSKHISDNFWQMGNTGPCGPSTEIFYDKGNKLFGEPPGINANCGERFVEIWNIVFMQFNKINSGNMIKLSQFSVDTGMGLERISAIIQNVTSNYEIDLFQPLVNLIIKMSNVHNSNNKHIYVIADHIRSSSFIISENIVPSNEKHGYVLRRIIRRAIRHGYYIGIKEPFLYKLVPTLIQSMGTHAHILKKKQQQIEIVLKLEEKKFINTLEKGLKLLEIEIQKLENNILSGKIVFKLYDTFGFPVDLTADICREKNITINLEEFKKSIEHQKKQAKNQKFYKKNNIKIDIQINSAIPSNFIGYNTTEAQSSITNIICNNMHCKHILQNELGILVLKNTPFYAESGGQIGDTGTINHTNGKFIVYDTKKYGGHIGHLGKVISGQLKINDIVTAKIDYDRRSLIQINHSATHLLHSSLRKILGNHVFQKGSYITNSFLRFDFSHYSPINFDDIKKIEHMINTQISNNILITTNIMELKEVEKQNITALFQEKYDKTVRVLSIDAFSIELCGGTHTKRTGDIGLFKIISEKSISSGIRRIEAVTGKIALSSIHKKEQELNEISTILKIKNKNIKNSIQNLLLSNKELKKEVNKMHEKEINEIVNQLSKNFFLIQNVKVIIHIFKKNNSKKLKNIIDKLKNKLGSVIIILINIVNNHATIIIGITSTLSKKIAADKLLSVLLKNLEGKGGGKSCIAEGGAKNLISLEKELINIKKWIKLNL
ncbi:MAG: alanine--tRNA ligase [Buchnera aphidicola (Meitanaphis microgallis)]